MIHQSQACRLQLSARAALSPAMPHNQSAPIDVQIQQLQRGEVFHLHLILQAQQQLRDLMAGILPSPAAAAAAAAAAAVDLQSDCEAVSSSNLGNDALPPHAVTIKGESARDDCKSLMSHSDAGSNSIRVAADFASQAANAQSSSDVSGAAASTSDFSSSYGVTVPTDRPNLTWNEFQAMNKGIPSQRLSVVWKSRACLNKSTPASSLQNTGAAQVFCSARASIFSVYVILFLQNVQDNLQNNFLGNIEASDVFAFPHFHCITHSPTLQLRSVCDGRHSHLGSLDCTLSVSCSAAATHKRLRVTRDVALTDQRRRAQTL
jgi:hypothetical protein